MVLTGFNHPAIVPLGIVDALGNRTKGTMTTNNFFSRDIHWSSKTDLWSTPQAFFDKYNATYEFTLDPCATPENAKCATYFTKEQDGLMQDWGTHTVWMNPPYGRTMPNWMQKAYESSLMGATVVCLVPARTDTKWWHDWAMKGDIEFIKGRLKFGDAKDSAPFPSVVITFKPQ